jgi:hypothetical protein
MMKRLSLLLAALFVGATLFAAPVIASGNSDNKNNNNDNEKVCVLRHEDDNGKDYRWVWDIEDLHVGDKVVKDKYCNDDHNGNGDHNGNHNGNHDGDRNGNHNGDHNGNDWS